MYTIKTDIMAGIVEVEIAGFWTEDEVAAFGRELNDAGRSIAATGKTHVMLCDYSKAAIQSQDVVALFRALVIDIPYKSSKLALYTTGPFARMQAKRVATARHGMAVFDDRVSALEWLMEDRIDRYARRG